ncbi:GerMN domain-containing protein [Streptomyces sp. NBC_00663]|uniref:GerMN domain-containing protein n=1 Tax=Streptomyces sp. NBC_00663 TaxID=2975801 RepID=UPI002E35F654|nr:Gmad2 immunoglobulin-like domain-containing protein [Streptomyces sp. NBC_00663]
MSAENTTMSRPYRPRRTLVLATAVVLASALSGGCGQDDGSAGASNGNDDTIPARGRHGTPTAPGTPNGSSMPSMPSMPMSPGPPHRQVRAAVYFLHSGQVSPAPRTVTAPTSAAGALRALLAGPSRYERDHGRTTAIPSGTTLRSLVVRHHVATIDLSGRYDDGGGSLSRQARLAQVVFTATRFPPIHKVRFELDGKPVTSFGGEEIVLNHPVGRAEFEDLAPQILVESPLIGDTVRTPLRISGSANTLEATFRLKITDAAGRTAADIRVTATSGSGTRGTFDVTIPYRATRSGAGLLSAYWNSLEDGHAVVEDTVPLTVQR